MAVSNPSLSLFLAVLLVGLASDGYRVSGLNISAWSGPSIQELNDLAHGYMTNSDLENAIKEFNDKCVNISRIYSIGKSVKGVPLWVMEISNNPGKEEAKPAFKFIGNVHGDEPVGRELLLNLAEWLCENYLTDELATLIVDNVHLHILPSMNPDGFTLRTRENANNIDLNRDFPDQFITANDVLKKRQPETRAIMEWPKRFTAFASIHGGRLVVSYPWDGTPDGMNWYHACPDDEVFRYMARLYSLSNPSMCKERFEGITNGARWYHLNGGMQDWNYIHTDCFELTLEISHNKWPPAHELESVLQLHFLDNIMQLLKIWQDNKMSMLNLVASVAQSGVNGKCFSSDGSGPLPASISVKRINYTSGVPGRISSSDSEEPFPASILVSGKDKTIQASKTLGYYHRLLVPGHQYEVTATMPGYITQSKTIITSTQGPVTLRFDLEPDTSEDNWSSNIQKYFYQNLESFQNYLAPAIFITLIGRSSQMRDWTK